MDLSHLSTSESLKKNFASLTNKNFKCLSLTSRQMSLPVKSKSRFKSFSLNIVVDPSNKMLMNRREIE